MSTLDPSFDEIAQFAHVGWGYLLFTLPILICSHFFSTIETEYFLWWWLGICVLGQATKEYWDANGLETPEVAGSSIKDFIFWCVGDAMGLAVLLIALRST